MPKEGEIRYIRNVHHSNILGIPFSTPGFLRLEQYLDGEWVKPKEWEVHLWSDKARQRRKK